ncbi:MAG TPA: SMC family ATPase [Streptosporangiaceae bacterium]
MENFGSFRTPANVDFHDVDYFVLVGPTGAGKSTVIDAICFAIYGTVPRWGKENVIALALAPSATTGKVALVFESAGRRYGIVRVLGRSTKGAVSTKEARLDELDPAIDPAADVDELLGAVVRPLAEGEDVTEEAQRLTGLEYRFFTQCVILPQGRFAEFLHSAPSKRQDLLVQLLDAEVYDQIRQRAQIEESKAANAAQSAQDQLDALTDADEAAEAAARKHRDELRVLNTQVRAGIDRLRAHDDTAAKLKAETEVLQETISALGSVVMPKHVSTLADDLRSVLVETERLAEEVARCEEALTEAEDERAALGDKAELTVAHQAHHDHERLNNELDGIRSELAAARTAAAQAKDEVEHATAALDAAETHLQHGRESHAAITIAQHLGVGEPCPVCLRIVTDLPRHPVAADLHAAQQNVQERRKSLETIRERHHGAELHVASLEQKVIERQNQLAGHAQRIQAHPDIAALKRRLTAIESADHKALQARQTTRTTRLAHKQAAQRRDSLRAEVDKALGDLDAARDRVVAYGAPPLERSDLRGAWTALISWCAEEKHRRTMMLDELRARMTDAFHSGEEERNALRELLDTRGIATPALLEADAISEAVAVANTRAEGRLDRVRENRARVATLEDEVRAHKQVLRIAHEVALRLKANNFEKWLCSEALEWLVAVASDTLKDLSDGQFELTLSDKSEIEVVDYAEAGMRRSVRTLSGGETFQASLALALALSDQIAGLGATAARSLDSIFLDEGFGTLDPATLDIVATTLERLSAGDRMVGIVTHVAALADRVPVRFEITRDAAGSHLEKKT